MKAFISIYFNISFIIYFLNLVNGNDNNICTICFCRITKQMSLIDCSSRKLVKSSLNWDNLVLPKKRFVNQEYVDFDLEELSPFCRQRVATVKQLTFNPKLKIESLSSTI